MARVVVALAVMVALAAVAIEARILMAPAGDVKTKQTIYNDPDGGVPPLEKRIADGQKKWAPTAAILEAEAECRKKNDLECKKVKKLKEAKKKAEEKAKGDKKEEQKAPCNQIPWVSYYLGTTCFPSTPYDVKPAKKKDDKKKAGK